MEREHGLGVYYFGIYIDPDPYRGRQRLKVDTRNIKSERNQRIAEQRKAERKLGVLHNPQLSDVERVVIRAQRQE